MPAAWAGATRGTRTGGRGGGTMGLTLAEKILSRRLGREVHAGEIVVTEVDMATVQDGTGVLTFDMIRELMGKDMVKYPRRAMLVLDHMGPAARPGHSNMHKR